MAKPARLFDTLAFIFSLLVVGLTVAWLLRQGIFSFTIDQDQNLAWHLIRSAGITAYVLLSVSVLWGLALSSQIVKNWSPGMVTMLMHSTISWLALAFSLVHALLLVVDEYFTYSVGYILIPFTGPYRPLAVGLGTLAFWIILVITLSFSLKKLIGRRLWKYIHMGSYLGFLLVTAHGLAAGTDADYLGFRVLLLAGVTVVVLLLGFRIGKSNASSQPKRRSQRQSPVTRNRSHSPEA